MFTSVGKHLSLIGLQLTGEDAQGKYRTFTLVARNDMS